MRDLQTSVVALVAVYLALAVYVVHASSLLASWSRQPGAGRTLAQLLRWRKERKAPKETIRERKVGELVARERVKRIQQYALPFAHCLAGAVALSALFPTLRLLSLVEGGEGAFALKCDALALLDLVWQLAICVLFAACPKLVTPRSVDAAYLALTGWWLFYAQAAGAESRGCLLAAPVAAVQRLVAGLVACNAQVTVACNLVVALTQCGVRLIEPGFAWEEKAELGLKVDATLALLVLLALAVFEHGVWAACRHYLEAKTSSKTEVTVLRLLSALCDAVVTLGPDLKIVSKAPKLANLLLIGYGRVGSSSRALEGSSFLELMAETDRVRFRHFLAQAPVLQELPDSTSDPAPAQALNTTLKDSAGIGVKVQLFHSHFQDANGQVGHLIGICEVGDTTNPCFQAETLSQTRSQENGRPGSPDDLEVSDSASTRRGVTDFDSESSLAGDSMASSLPPAVIGSRSTDQVPPLRSQSAGEDWARRGPPNQPPHEVSLAFGSLRFTIWQHQNSTPVIDASLMERESLQEWVTEWTSCRVWIQDLLNAALRPVHATSWPAAARPPSSLTFRVAFEGNCTLPSDLLTRTPNPSTVPGVSSIVGPPTRLNVSRVKLDKRAPSSRSISSDRRASRSRRQYHHSHGPSIMAAAAVHETAGTSPPSKVRVVEESEVPAEQQHPCSCIQQ